MSVLVRASLLDAPTPGALRAVADGHLAVDHRGCVASAGPWSERPDAGFDRVIDLSGRVVLPGFVDAHFHIPQVHVRGRTGLPLLEWLDQVVFPEEQRFADPDLARRTARDLFPSLRARGTVAGGFYLPVQPDSARACLEEAVDAGFPGVYGKVLMDRGVPEGLREDADAGLHASRSLAREFDGMLDGRLRYAVTPRFAPACSSRLLRGAGDLARRYDVPVQTHLSESPAEVANVEARFKKPYAQVYDDAGLLGEKTLLAHCIHLSDAEWGLVAERGCTAVHCPTSNEALASGRFPLERVPDDVPLALATDVGAGPWLRMQTVLAAARRIHPEARVSAARLLHLATAAGARALGLHRALGAFDPGCEATFQVYDREAESAWDAGAWFLRLVEGDVRPQAVFIRGERA